MRTTLAPPQQPPHTSTFDLITAAAVRTWPTCVRSGVDGRARGQFTSSVGGGARTAAMLHMLPALLTLPAAPPAWCPVSASPPGCTRARPTHLSLAAGLSSQGACVESCPQGTFAPGGEGSVCEPCDVSCSACDGPTNSSCTSCRAGDVLVQLGVILPLGEEPLKLRRGGQTKAAANLDMLTLRNFDESVPEEEDVDIENAYYTSKGVEPPPPRSRHTPKPRPCVRPALRVLAVRRFDR